MALKLEKFPFKALGCHCEVQLYADSAAEAGRVAERVIADVVRIERRYSRYRDDSDLAAINRAAACGGQIEVDDETLGLLHYADACFRQSDGLFDISSGILREAWDFKSQRIPELGRIEALLPRIGWDKVAIDGSVVRFAVPGMQLDFGGIGKEYAADRAAGICLQNGLTNGLVDLGGDIKIIGPHADGRPWLVGVRHPRNRDQLLANIAVSGGGIASSGDYERCIVIDGKRYSHILNPKTGWPVGGLASVTVIAEQCLVAGSLTTITLLKEDQGKHWIKEMGLGHLWMDQDGQVGGTLAEVARVG